MIRDHIWSRLLVSAGALVAFSVLPMTAQAAGRERQMELRAADPTEQGDGTMSAAARRAMTRGALPKDSAEVAAKAAITAASTMREPSSAGPLSPEAAGGGGGPLAVISGGHNFAGQFDSTGTPPDTTGAIGTTRFIQLVNRKFGIYNRTTNALINSGTLNQLAGLAATVNTFDPQIIWDDQTNRFYYMNDSIFSATDNRLSFGFSKTASPSSAADFCHYTLGYGSEFPDYPKLGDSRPLHDRGR